MPMTAQFINRITASVENLKKKLLRVTFSTKVRLHQFLGATLNYVTFLDIKSNYLQLQGMRYVIQQTYTGIDLLL